MGSRCLTLALLTSLIPGSPLETMVVYDCKLLLLFLIPLTRSDDCQYNCEDRGGCSVMWTGVTRSGYTQGYCTSDGRCAATPPECVDCKDHCGTRSGNYHHKNSQPIISPPQIEAVEFEENDYDEDDNGVIIADPPAPPPTMVGPPAPPTQPPVTQRPTTTTTTTISSTTTRRPVIVTTARPVSPVGPPSTARPPVTRPSTARPPPPPPTQRPRPPRPVRPQPPPRPSGGNNPFTLLQRLIAQKIQWKVNLVNGLFRKDVLEKD